MKKGRLTPVLVLAGATLVFLHKLLSLGFITIGNVEDHLRLLYPYRSLDAEHLRALSLPLWNPTTFSGFPYFASVNCHIFYPVNLLFLVLPTHLGMNFSLVIHVFLAGLFMFLLASELGIETWSAAASALAFMFSGIIIQELWWGHETVMGSMTWTPLVFLLFLRAVRKKDVWLAVLGGIVFAVQMFAGHPQFPYYGLLALSLLALYFALPSFKTGWGKEGLRPILCFLVIALVGYALYAVQMIPAAELSRYSVRALGQADSASYTRWSMGLPYLITLIFPRTTPVIGVTSWPFPISLGYVGLAALVLAILSIFSMRKKPVPFFWLLTLLSLIFAGGRHTPVYGAFYRFFPGFSAFRNPIFFLYLFVFSVAVLSGFGAAFLKTAIWQLKEKTLKRMVGGLIAPGVFLVIIALLVFSLVPKGTPESGLSATTRVSAGSPGSAAFIGTKVQKYRDSLVYDLGTMGLIFLAATVPFLVRKKIAGRDGILSAVIILAVFSELGLYGGRFLRTYDLTPFVSKGEWVDFLKSEKDPFRVLPILDYPEQDAVLKLNKISSINGYGSIEILKDYYHFLQALEARPVIQELTLMRVGNYGSPAVDLLNTKFILTSKTIEGGSLRLVHQGEIPAAKTWDPDRKDTVRLNIYKNPSALPRAFIVHSVEVARDREQILTRLKDPDFDARHTLILEDPPDEAPENVSPGDGEETVSFPAYKDDEIVVKAELAKKGFLFLSEVQYPGWKVFVDGKEDRIQRADYLFRSVFLEEGSHTVRFVFAPSSLRSGALISGLAGACLIVGFLVKIRGNRRRRALHRRENKPASNLEP